MSKHPMVEARALTRFKAGGKVYPEGPCKVPAALADELVEAGLIALAPSLDSMAAEIAARAEAERASAEAKAEAERIAAEAAAQLEAEQAAEAAKNTPPSEQGGGASASGSVPAPSGEPAPKPAGKPKAAKGGKAEG